MKINEIFNGLFQNIFTDIGKSYVKLFLIINVKVNTCMSI